MSDVVTLTLRAPLDRRLEADAIVPDRIAGLAAAEVARLVLWDGPQPVPLGDVFDVHGDRAAAVRIAGDASRLDALGAGMSAGSLSIDGPAGRYAGTRMSGGELRIAGDAGDGAGLEMVGGVIDIAGSAGDRVGGARLAAPKGMLGGTIIVRGAAGTDAGARMRRGTIVCGHAGPRAGAGMIAGSVIVLGDVAGDCGRGNKRGSIVVLGRVAVPRGYRYACTYRPPHVTLTLRHLRTQYAVPIRDEWIAALYRRYSGDLAELGRGELLTRQSDA